MEAAALELIHSPDHNRRVIEVPVRHGKSYYNSSLLPAWHLLKYPNKNIAVVTYGNEFGSEWGAKVRQLVSEWGHLTGVKIDPGSRRKDFFKLAPPYTGEFRGLGIGGALAGKGFHLVVGDDLVKEFSEVATEEARDTLFKRFHGELLSRGEPGCKVILVMSRRHPDDLSGRLMAQNPRLSPDRRWERLRFRAINEAGEALWPERYPIDALKKIRHDFKVAGQLWQWHNLYQQDPDEAAEGSEWPARYWKDLYFQDKPNFKPRRRLVAIDAAAGKHRQAGDFGAIIYADEAPDGTFWVDASMTQEPITEFEARAAKTLRQRAPDWTVVEVSGEQWSVGKNISATQGSGPMSCYETENPEVSIRMLLTPLLHAGKLRIKDTPNGRILGNQLRDFPLGKHRSGPHALMLLIQLRDTLNAPDASEDTFSPVTT